MYIAKLSNFFCDFLGFRTQCGQGGDGGNGKDGKSNLDNIPNEPKNAKEVYTHPKAVKDKDDYHHHTSEGCCWNFHCHHCHDDDYYYYRRVELITPNEACGGNGGNGGDGGDGGAAGILTIDGLSGVTVQNTGSAIANCDLGLNCSVSEYKVHQILILAGNFYNLIE